MLREDRHEFLEAFPLLGACTRLTHHREPLPYTPLLMMHSNETNPTIRLLHDHADRLIRGISSGSHELYRPLRDFVNARSSRCHSEDHPLTPIIEDTDDELQQSSCGFGPVNQPSAKVVRVTQRTGAQSMNKSSSTSLPSRWSRAALARGTVDVKQHEPMFDTEERSASDRLIHTRHPRPVLTTRRTTFRQGGWQRPARPRPAGEGPGGRLAYRAEQADTPPTRQGDAAVADGSDYCGTHPTRPCRALFFAPPTDDSDCGKFVVHNANVTRNCSHRLPVAQPERLPGASRGNVADRQRRRVPPLELPDSPAKEVPQEAGSARSRPRSPRRAPVTALPFRWSPGAGAGPHSLPTPTPSHSEQAVTGGRGAETQPRPCGIRF